MEHKQTTTINMYELLKNVVNLRFNTLTL